MSQSFLRVSTALMNFLSVDWLSSSPSNLARSTLFTSVSNSNEPLAVAANSLRLRP